MSPRMSPIYLVIESIVSCFMAISLFKSNIISAVDFILAVSEPSIDRIFSF